MTDAEALALGKRAVACRGWRWMPRMHGLDIHANGFTFLFAHPSGGAIVLQDGAVLQTLPVSREFMRLTLPDLRDPATLGCLLALVREAHGALVYVEPRWDLAWRLVPMMWEVYTMSDSSTIGPSYKGATEAEALVAALEGAP